MWIKKMKLHNTIKIKYQKKKTLSKNNFLKKENISMCKPK